MKESRDSSEGMMKGDGLPTYTARWSEAWESNKLDIGNGPAAAAYWRPHEWSRGPRDGEESGSRSYSVSDDGSKSGPWKRSFSQPGPSR